ncbi:MAG: 2-oxoglutarate oxidoreductase [Rhodothermales bacterium]|nr:2-oxoglutarate oxidoreductase [Rhodothermales bacterium]
MFGFQEACHVDLDQDYYSLQDYQSAVPRWCPGCGDNAILTSVQRLCRDEQLPPEKTVFVSGIGCSSRFPHYMGTYGFHGLHGRALPIAEGVKIRRPDLHVFVNMGDGDCCSIGTAHWIHAIRYNMNLVAMVHDNEVYGMTKMQASPTSPRGFKTNTTPRGALLEPLNMLSTTLGVTNVSFVANVVEWVPEALFQVLSMAYKHKGFSFVRIIQRCPHFHSLFDPMVRDPDSLVFLTGDRGIELSDDLKKVYKRTASHDASDINKARELAQMEGGIPIGVLYQNPEVAVYDELRKPVRDIGMEDRRRALEAEFDRFAVDAG